MSDAASSAQTTTGGAGGGHGAGEGRDDAKAQVAEALVAGFARLIKAARLYDHANQGAVASVDQMAATVADFCTKAGAGSASVLFADSTVFVNGQSFRITRETYTAAMQVGALLDKCGVSEISFDRSVPSASVAGLARAVADFLANPTGAAPLSSLHLAGVRARRVHGSAGQARDGEGGPSTQIVRLYATALVVLRSFYGKLKKGPQPLPHTIKRIAQKLVASTDEDPRLLLALTGSRTTDREAALAINTAIIAVLVARKLTADRGTLSGLAMAALLLDVGRSRLLTWNAGEALSAVERDLSDAEERRLPASTAAVIATLAPIRPPTMARAALAFEATWLRGGELRGPLYAGRRSATGLARLLSLARTLSELLLPQGKEEGDLDEALALLVDGAADDTERQYVKLIIGALGIFPPGTMVELSTGEIAVVVSAPARPVDFARPPVRIMNGPDGAALAQPLDIDLASPAVAAAPARCIRRALEMDDAQVRAMRDYVAQLPRVRREPAPRPAARPKPAAPAPVPARPVAASLAAAASVAAAAPARAAAAPAPAAATPVPAVLDFSGGGDAAPVFDLPELEVPAATIIDPGFGASMAPPFEVPPASGGAVPLLDIPPLSGATAPLLDIPPLSGAPAPRLDIPPLAGQGAASPRLDLPPLPPAVATPAPATNAPAAAAVARTPAPAPATNPPAAAARTPAPAPATNPPAPAAAARAPAPATNAPAAATAPPASADPATVVVTASILDELNAQLEAFAEAAGAASPEMEPAVTVEIEAAATSPSASFDGELSEEELEMLANDAVTRMVKPDTYAALRREQSDGARPAPAAPGAAARSATSMPAVAPAGPGRSAAGAPGAAAAPVRSAAGSAAAAREFPPEATSPAAPSAALVAASRRTPTVATPARPPSSGELPVLELDELAAAVAEAERTGSLSSVAGLSHDDIAVAAAAAAPASPVLAPDAAASEDPFGPGVEEFAAEPTVWEAPKGSVKLARKAKHVDKTDYTRVKKAGPLDIDALLASEGEASAPAPATSPARPVARPSVPAAAAPVPPRKPPGR